jgi:AsmA family
MTAIAALLLILFLWRPGVYRLRGRIAGSIGSALDRRVTLDNVSMRILPRPGFDLEGLVIYDDPAFSAEPMIRAQEVSAAIRLSSLLRGRLEISTLSATEPSINLVRNQGRWNLASLLERNAQIPAAPTAKPASERRPAFPYLEASSARINFKIGQTKKSYALMDADVALWQDSENSWGARIKAEPVRTDFNLTDTGLLQINATWQRATSLRLTPLQVTAQWRNGQLGQITKLLSGKDRGWRGGVNLTAKLSGTPEALRIESRTIVEDFHRYDIAESESISLTTACSGQFDAVTATLADLRCESPVGGGTIRLRGSLTSFAQAPAYDLTFEAQKLPLSSVVRLLRQAKKQIPADLTATGLLNAEFHATQSVPGRDIKNHSSKDKGSIVPEANILKRTPSATPETTIGKGTASAVPPEANKGLGFSPRGTPSLRRALTQWTGSGAATNVRLSSNSGKDEVVLGTIPLTLVSADSGKGKLHPKTNEPGEQEPSEPHLRIGPVTLAMNAAEPLNAGGWLSSAGYRFFLRGDLELKNLFRLENVLALPAARPAAEGMAKADVSVSGPWQGFAPPVFLGTAQLRNVRAEMHGLNTPIEIGAAAISLTPDAVLLHKISARTGSTHWSGGVTAPRHCLAPNCVYQFDLTADQLSTEDIAEWFTPQSTKRPWYRILTPSKTQGASPLLTLQARGSLHVGRFGLKKVSATQVATQIEVDRGKITLTALRGQLLQGTHQGNWVIDVSGPDVSTGDSAKHSIRYRGSGTLQNISLAAVGSVMNDAWISGTADGKFDLDGRGDNFRDLLSHADAKLRFTMRNGSLPHVEIPGSPGPLPVHRFTGELQLRQGGWKLSAGRLESHDGIYRVSGTASPAIGFEFVLTRGDEQSWTLTGTLAKPHVAPRTETSRAEADPKTVKP